MTAGKPLMRASVRLVTCACLLLVFSALAAAPLARLLPQQDQCNCGCQHDGRHACCCRRAARQAGAYFEATGGCPGKCQLATPVPLRLGLFLPLRRGAFVSGLVAASRAIPVFTPCIPGAPCSAALHERSPPLISLNSY